MTVFTITPLDFSTPIVAEEKKVRRVLRLHSINQELLASIDTSILASSKLLSSFCTVSGQELFYKGERLGNFGFIANAHVKLAGVIAILPSTERIYFQRDAYGNPHLSSEKTDFYIEIEKKNIGIRLLFY